MFIYMFVSFSAPHFTKMDEIKLHVSGVATKDDFQYKKNNLISNGGKT